MSVLSYDVETDGHGKDGLNRWTAGVNMFSFSVCNQKGNASVHRLTDVPAISGSRNLRLLDHLWGEDNETEFTGHNIKFDMGFTEKLLKRPLRSGIKRIHDTMLMSRVLRNDNDHGLKELAWSIGGVDIEDKKAISEYTRGGHSYRFVPENLMNQYQIRDAERGMLMFLYFWPMIQANKNFLEIYLNERDVIVPTLAMEDRGVMIHRGKAEALIIKLKNDAEQVLQQIHAEMGERVVPGTEAFIDRLYKKYDLPVLRRTKKQQRISINKDVLMTLREQFPEIKVLSLALMFKSWERGASMIRSYLSKADENDVLHPIINSCEAVTGRESTENPSLQNVEKTGVLLNPYPVPARTCFRPRPNYVNFHLDYSGQEARLLIHYSGDSVLLRICNEGDGDTHTFVAEIFYGQRFRNGTKEDRKVMRNATKNGFFAISYGASFHKTAKTLGLNDDEGRAAYSAFKQLMPKLINLMPEIVRTVKAKGYIETAFGRHLYIPREQAYIGVNYLIQGTAAEMLKRGQVPVHDYLEKATGGEMKLLLPIHDELIIECPRNRLQDAKPILKHVAHLMTDFPGRFKVPMAVEVDVATVDWSQKIKFPLN